MRDFVAPEQTIGVFPVGRIASVKRRNLHNTHSPASQLHRFCVLCRTRPGARLVVRDRRPDRIPGTARFWGKSDRANPRCIRLFETFHRQMAGFRDLVHKMLRKY